MIGRLLSQARQRSPQRASDECISAAAGQRCVVAADAHCPNCSISSSSCGGRTGRRCPLTGSGHRHNHIAAASQPLLRSVAYYISASLTTDISSKRITNEKHQHRIKKKTESHADVFLIL